TSPDYKGQDPEQAALDFRNRIRNYEKVYKTIDGDGDESSYTYLKILDVGSQVIINRIKDYLQSRVVYYLMNLHIRPRSIWLSRHGESMGLIGVPIMGWHSNAAVRYFGVFLVTAGANSNVPAALSYQANNIRGQWKRAFCSATFVGFGGIGGIAGSLVFR
ncbi:hypothetical protein I5L01_15380, partial [Erythrobacter sp. YJ-T3-07]|nr:hypothetical protein [Erythrobacter sp. YJ-T3-07]